MPIDIKLKRVDDKLKEVPTHMNMDIYDFKVVDSETGQDISKNIREIDINLSLDNFSTAKLVVDVGNIEIDGVSVKDVVFEENGM